MGSLRFPFPFPLPEKPPNGLSFRRVAVAVTATAAVAAGAGLTVSASVKQSAAALPKPSNDDAAHLCAASVSLDPGPPRPDMYVHPLSNVEFPKVIDGEKRLLNVGTRLRRRYRLWSRRITYVFGVYADGCDVKRLSKKYGAFSASELKGNKDFIEDVLDQDLRITIRFKRSKNSLNMKSLLDDFQYFVGKSLQKFSGSDSKELLQRFNSLLRDEYKITKESFLDISREHGHVLRVQFNGKELGKLPSKILGKSILDAYFGPDAFDKEAREEFKSRLISMLLERSDP